MSPLHRERKRLVAERVQHVNRIKGLCAAQGIYNYAPLRPDRWSQLDKLRTGDGRSLPARLKSEIVRELKRLELVLEMIETVEVERVRSEERRVGKECRSRRSPYH